MQLVQEVKDMLEETPQLAAVLSLPPFEDFAGLMGALFTGLTGNAAIGEIARRAYQDNPALEPLTTYDVTETARRNFEPGGPPAVLLFARGLHAVTAHRVAHHLWTQGETTLALALKSTCGRALGTDIHPAAQIGAGLWLDHGLGVVIGETCVIEADVSIWHNVTLGSTLGEGGALRHPHIGQGAVIGAGATVLGHIHVGAGANIAAGAIVLADVPAQTLVTGHKAQARGAARISFAPKGTGA
ncbi:serine acetyltransferase [Alphaproteobacteria bacterium KMM 3653]|uniref:serine O-acetyltransferase n=2 Tax=Harenicola maris TaxID=2841044 RepID=A0AAP2G7F5_9RHOB|nr:serine acetyltransferase [Harenicola maris]